MNDQSDATATSSVGTLPTGHQTVNPFVIVDGAGAFIDFVGGVFGAVEASNVRTPDRDGRLIHAEVRLGTSTIMLADAKPGWRRFTALLQVYVDDAAAVLERASARGADIVTEPTPFYGGVLIARFLDPWRNLWWVYQPLDSAAEARAAASQATGGDTSWHNREPSYVYRSLMDGMELLRREFGQ